MNIKPTLRERLFRRLFRAEYEELKSVKERNHHLNCEIRDWRAHAERRKSARLQVEGLMAEETALGKLAGTHHSDPIQAIEALLNHRIVQLSDEATNPPRAMTADERLFAAGGVHHVAEFLGLLQEATADRDVEGVKQ